MRTAEKTKIPLNCVQPFSHKGYHQFNLANEPLYSNIYHHQTAVAAILDSVLLIYVY